MKFKALFLFVVATLVSGVWADPTASIFVKDADEFNKIKKDLENLKTGLGQNNADFDSLWQKAERIAKMNDQCSMISINEVLNDECSHFYAVELPEFETKYMEVTGELRLGAMTMGNSLAERTEQIKTCATALGGILVSKEQLLKLNGSVDLEPLSLDGAFDATYNFNLYYDSGRMEQQRRMMERWLSKCGDIVMRKSGDEFAPLFIDRVNVINDSLKKTSANVQIVVEPALLDFYLDMNKPIPGAYYLNGARLFSVNELPTGRRYSHLIVNLPRRKVNLPLGTDGEMQTFKGRVEFKSVYQDKDLVGRWTWGEIKDDKSDVVVKEVNTNAVEGDSSVVNDTAHVAGLGKGSVEDQLKKDMAEQKAKEDAAKDAAKGGEKKSRIHIIPLAICGAVAIGGGVMAAVFNNKAKTERNAETTSNEDFNDHRKKIEDAQTMRTVGLGIIGLGLVGAGVTFLF